MGIIQKINSFLQQQHYMVVSTVNKNGQTESALVAFSNSDKLEVFFSSESWRRKNKNIKSNPKVSIVFGFEAPITVQFEGTARVLSKDEAKPYLEKQFEKNPGSEEYHKDPKEEHILITPTWVRYSNLRKKPFEITEHTF